MRHGALRLTRLALAAQCRCSVSYEARRWSSVTTRTWSTPLAKTIADAIEATGPISIAAYMRQVLTSDRGGYYTTTRTADQFGQAGDFITSPEISQIFGELCGIWFMTEWLGQGRKNRGVQLIEMGPGRGTLMSDMLRTIVQFKTFAASIDAVWMIEAGEGLRLQQKDLLCGADAELKKMYDGSGWSCLSTSGIPVHWVEDIALLPKCDAGNTMPFIIAHEFFDALPIHAFESVAPSPHSDQPTIDLLDETGQVVRKSSRSSSLKPQWRELLVSPTPWKPSLISTQAEVEKSPASRKDLPPDFQLTLAKASTPTSLVMTSRARYEAVKSQPGSRIEISPESARYVGELARRVGKAGAALIVDYGPMDTIPVNSLRGIKSHKIISPFSMPGEADVSADVDFIALAEAALDASENVEVYGPVEQGLWLLQLGIKERAEQLLRNLQDKATKTEFETGWKRLVEGAPRGMGKAYKVMSIVPGSGGKRWPVGFGGSVQA